MPRNRSEKGPAVLDRKEVRHGLAGGVYHLTLTRLPDGGLVVALEPDSTVHRSIRFSHLPDARAMYDRVCTPFYFGDLTNWGFSRGRKDTIS